SERTLHQSGAIADTVQELRERGLVEDRDGAVWLRTSQFGDDKDRPLIRSNGAPTYLAADVVYYRDKRRRGFDRLIFLWGADHHGYVPRMRAVARAFGDPDDTTEFIIGQLVTLVRGGQPAKMSKRAGDIVTVDDLIDEVGKDAFRYTMLRTSVDTPLVFDVEAVTRQSMDNPVHYGQDAPPPACAPPAARPPASRWTTRSTTSSPPTPASPASCARAARRGSRPCRSRRPTWGCSATRWRPPCCAAWPPSRSWCWWRPSSAPPIA